MVYYSFVKLSSFEPDRQSLPKLFKDIDLAAAKKDTGGAMMMALAAISHATVPTGKQLALFMFVL